MKRIAQIAVPLLVVAAVAGAALAVYRRRVARPELPRYRVETGTRVDPHADASAGNAGAGVEVLVGYDERHEEEEEARHGSLLHIDTGKLSVGQF